MQISRGTKISIVLHLVLLALVIFGLPAFFDAKHEEQPVIISVELLPVTGVDNIKPAARKPAPQMEQPKEQPKPVEQPKPQPKPEAPKPAPASSAALIPPTPVQDVVKEDAPKEKPKVPEKPKDQPKPKPKDEKPKEKKSEDDLDSILKSVAKAAKTEEKQSPKAAKPTEATAPAKEASDAHNNSQNYNPDLPLSMSELSAIQSQIIKCWSIPAGAKDAHTLVVVLRVQLNQDGSLINAQLAENQGRYNSDNFFRAATDSAIRAVRRCSPLKGLPLDKYGTWKDFELNFDPQDALY